MGSLFDGVAMFPLAAQKNGIKAVWASEIEKFPIAVSKHHFPDMKHLGDVCLINGAEIEPADIITFSSPCQDLSVAGKRAGLAGERSGLFSEAVRIIREMREATNGEYPKYAIWENVPGAFSSNKGQDFRTVLEEITAAEIPMPKSGKWANAGMVRGNGYSVAWRVCDAQYWGVAQRRKRIFLIVSFGKQCAGEILFESPCLHWDSKESGETRKEVAGSVGNGVKGTEYLTGWDCQEKRIFTDRGVAPTISGSGGGSGGRTMAGYVAQTTGLPIWDIGDRRRVLESIDVSPTLLSKMGTGGNNVPIVPITFRDTAGTLRANAGAPKHESDWEKLVVHPLAFNGRQDPVHGQVTGAIDTDRATQCVLHPKVTGTICASGAGTNRPAGQGNETDLCIVFAQNQRDEVRDLGDKTGALAAQPGIHQQTFVAHIAAYPEPANALLAKGNLSYRADVDNLVCAVDVRNLYETEELSGTLQSKNTGGYSLNYQNPVRVGYAVRRLMPIEAERLMSMPDGWTDIPGASNTARYKAIGNSLVCNIVDWIFSQIVNLEKETSNAK